MLAMCSQGGEAPPPLRQAVGELLELRLAPVRDQQAQFAAALRGCPQASSKAWRRGIHA